jgi:hypothetical protein
MNLLPAKREAVVFKEVTDGAVLLSTEDEIYFGLNRVGAQVWTLLPPKLDTFAELCREIGNTYPDVDAAILEADLRELLELLTKEGLVRSR